MKRKHFLSALFPAAFTLSSATVLEEKSVFLNRYHIKIPPYLKAGDVIGITCPASYISLEECEPAIQQMQNWGFKIEVGKTVGKRSFTFGGTDDERLADLQYMLNNPNIKAIMCARGGYGLVRIIDALDFKKFKTNPKWIIGFSDITVLHNHLNRNLHTATLHAKMCNSFPADWNLAEPIQVETILSIKKALMGERLGYSSMPNQFNCFGKATGELVGGNLTLIATLAGSKSDLITKNKILFLEDTHEQLYNLDRLFFNLKRSGKLDNLSGLIIGGFNPKPDDAGEEFGKTIEAIVLEKVTEYHYPVCFDFPVGHQKSNFALKCGVRHHLLVDENGGKLVES
ncbi:MAG: LD-carboxypeptidase [Sphingobacteriaceae bacterium]|nr:MAG: LD-carboxypeptidase [Sphingobacteriaceae bacterium]